MYGLIGKLKANPGQRDELISILAKAAEAEGADAVTLVNTFVGMVVDVEKRKPRLANAPGGLSGPAIRAMAVAMTWNVARAVKIPVVGMGGIMTARDALEFLQVSATAVQVGTANFVNPGAAADVVAGLRTWLTERGNATVRELIGTMRLEPVQAAPR